MDMLQRYIEAYRAVIRGPAEPTVVDNILSSFGISNGSYREWLIASDGGPIGPDWYDGVEDLPRSQKKLKEEQWHLEGFVIGWDGAGNPIVLNNKGEILTEDHTFGGIHRLAGSFDELLSKYIS